MKSIDLEYQLEIQEILLAAGVYVVTKSSSGFPVYNYL
jgi:hypothetical protein